MADVASLVGSTVSAGFQTGSAGFSKSPVKSHSTPELRKKTWFQPTTRLPRDGPESGGGKLSVGDRTVFEAYAKEAEDDAEHAMLEQELLEATRRPSNVSKRKSGSRMSTGQGSRKNNTEAAPRTANSEGAATGSDVAKRNVSSPDSKSASEGLAAQLARHPDGPEARKFAELQSKWDRADAIRQADRKIIREKVEKGKEMREERFKRLLDSVCGHGGLAMEAAENLRTEERRHEERRAQLHMEYDENVNRPVATQAFEQLNPPDRAMLQQSMGSKSVSWKLPDQQFRLRSNAAVDPVRRPVVENARENAFHQAACSVLGQSSSSPVIFRRSAAIDGDLVVPRALSRPVLEPSEWGQVKLQGTPFGRFAQICEHGPGFPRTKRGGTNAFLPDESDGIHSAGTRTDRELGHGDKGILKGDRCTAGESADYKSWEGASSGAPAQDHFTYQDGDRITNLEFPLGKKIFPEFH
eukprot:TRINITY_DN42497_c0_g1_i1.p1 TRINITY_DN42497_c0_g1~~TRINITY_DN42497_c0_g1_i1.p1  ORF type:complete len:469 (-),score=92.04 TRINITY_DN42497_c0_g1_i1:98-1504(-)